MTDARNHSLGATRILAGDIGGTKTLLALFAHSSDGRLTELRRTRYASREYASLLPILRAFLQGESDIQAATFGVAGPVTGGVCRATNLPWIVDAGELSATLSIPRITLLNDFHAAALGIGALCPDDLAVLQDNPVDPSGTVALLGAGTGLGEAIVIPGPTGPHVIASEGGHSDFAARDEVEIGLLRFLLARHRRVSVERVVSGIGLKNIYDYLVSEGLEPTTEATATALHTQDPGGVIGQAAQTGSDRACVRAVQMFAAAYGAEAGNLALKCLPTGGVYIAGGIAPRLLPALQAGGFRQAFITKGRMSPLLEGMHVAVVLNPDLGLLGARDHAAGVLGAAAAPTQLGAWPG